MSVNPYQEHDFIDHISRATFENLNDELLDHE
jgi:hypothetical protein